MEPEEGTYPKPHFLTSLGLQSLTRDCEGLAHLLDELAILLAFNGAGAVLW